MKCVVQIGSFPLSSDCIRGGVEASVYGLAKVQSRAFEVHVFDVPRVGGSHFVENIGRIIVHRFSNHGSRQFTAVRQVSVMAKEIQSLQPEACHIHGTNLFSWLMYRELKRMKLPVIVTIHGLVRVEKLIALKKSVSVKKMFQYLYQGWAEMIFLSHLPIAIVDTDYVREKVNRYPILRKPEMYVIPQGIDESFFSLRCSKESKVVLSVGAIGERKGHLITLQAFEQVMVKGTGAQLIIAGTIADRKYLKRLQEAIANSKYNKQISLYLDLSDEALKQLYEKAHLFVLHSEEESQGIVFAEAMAMGLPIVATRVGGIPWVIEHGKNGLLSDFGDVDAFAEHIQNLMMNASMWNVMSESSLEAAQKYHWCGISDKIITLYHHRSV